LEMVLRPVAKGEVHYHHSLTWHGSHQNTSMRPRRAVAIHLTDVPHFSIAFWPPASARFG